MSIKSDIINIYIGYYNRAPDIGGLNYWIGRANAGMTMSDIAASYSVQVESTTNYPYLADPASNSAIVFINKVYANLFNRAPDAGGLAYWKSQLEAANGNPDAIGSMILNIISGATTAPDSTILANKGIVALDWVTSVAAIPGFTFDDDAKANSLSVLAGVDATSASVTAATAATDAFVANPHPASISLSVGNTTADEGNSGTNTMAFILTLDSTPTSAIVVNYVTGGSGTATVGSDYVAAAGSVTFAAGETSKIVSVSINGDTNVESDETIEVTFTSTKIANSGVKAIGTIINDDTAADPVLSIGNVSVSEGNSGTTNMTFTLTLDSAQASAVAITYVTSGSGTATAGVDYGATAGAVVFAAGETSKTINVAINGDTDIESDETFEVTFTSTQLGNSGVKAIGTIINDDTAPDPTLSVGNATVSEGDSGTTTMAFILSLDSAPTSNIVVNYVTGSGTASAGTDYVAAAGSVTFAAGETNKTVSVIVNGDTDVESDETVEVTFTSSNLANSGVTATGTITNDDVDPDSLPKTITLTAGVDAGADFVGGSAGDTFNGTDTTFNNGDTLDGAGSNDDTLKIIATSATTTTPTLTSIEKLEIVALHNGSTTIEMAVSTGVNTVTLKDSKGGIVLNGVKDILDLEASNTTDNAHLIVFYDSSAVSGSSDTQKITLNSAMLPGAIAIDNVETFNIFASGTNMATNIIGAKTVNVSGSGSLEAEFRSSDSTSGTFDASSSSGKQDIDFQSGKSYSVKTGSGDDVLEFSGTNDINVESGEGDDILDFSSSFDAGDSVNGGGGKDTLVLNSFNVSTTLINATTSIEVLVSESASNGLTATDYTNINEFIFAGGPSGSRVNVRGVETDDRFVFSADQGNGDEAVRFEGASAGQSLTFELRASSANNGEVVIEADTNTGNDYAAVGFQSNISSVTLASTGTNTKDNMIHAVDGGSNNYYAFANDGGLANFTIIGSQNLTIGAKEGAAMSSSSDTFGFQNAVNLNAVDFTGNLRVAGSNSDDTITGGHGNDIIYGMSGDDTLTGNDGSDQFRFVGTNSTDTIKDFVKTEDKVGFNLFDFGNTTASSAGAVLSTSDYVDNRNGITTMGSADDNKLVELQSALSTSQIQSDTGAAIEAYVVVFNTTTGKGELWYDNDWSSTGSRKHVATFNDIVDLTGVTDFSNTDFVEFVA